MIEQNEDAVLSVASSQKTRYSIMVDTVMGALLASLVIGFFAFVWRTSTGLEDGVIVLKNEIQKSRMELSAQKEVFSSELAALKLLIQSMHANEAKTEPGKAVPAGMKRRPRINLEKSQKGFATQEAIRDRIYKRSRK